MDLGGRRSVGAATPSRMVFSPAEMARQLDFITGVSRRALRARRGQQGRSWLLAGMLAVLGQAAAQSCPCTAARPYCGAEGWCYPSAKSNGAYNPFASDQRCISCDSHHASYAPSLPSPLYQYEGTGFCDGNDFSVGWLSSNYPAIDDAYQREPDSTETNGWYSAVGIGTGMCNIQSHEKCHAICTAIKGCTHFASSTTIHCHACFVYTSCSTSGCGGLSESQCNGYAIHSMVLPPVARRRRLQAASPPPSPPPPSPPPSPPPPSPPP